MKIAIIVKQFPKLSETFILNQITGLLDLGHDVGIFAYSNPHDKKIHPDVKKYRLMDRVYYFNRPSNRLMRWLKGFGLLLTKFHKAPSKLLESVDIFKYGKDALSLRFLYAVITFLDRSQNYDIIHCHFGPNGYLGTVLKRLNFGKKLLVTFHGYDMSEIFFNKGNDVYHLIFDNADLLMPISNYWRMKLIEIGANPEKVLIHRMGIDIEQFKFKVCQYNRNQAIKLLTVARLVEKKGIEYGIRAVSIVCQRHPELSIQYDIVGAGPLRSYLESLVKQLELHKKVRLLGGLTQDDVSDLMAKAHIFLLPSVTAKNGDQEGIPVSIMEAMACGMPVLSTVHSGIPELVQNGQSGFLVPERDVDALAERLEYLIEHPEIWPEMGKSGRKFVEEHYDIRKLNQKLVRIYQDLINGKYV